MSRTFLIGVLFALPAVPGWAQFDSGRQNADRSAGSLTVIEGDRSLLAAGASAIRDGRYDDGIRLTLMGLEEPTVSNFDRAAANANLCAAHAAKNEPDLAIEYCDRSIEMNDRNWRAYSNRAFAHWLKGMVSDALYDLDAATAKAKEINANPPQIAQIKKMIDNATPPTVFRGDAP